jgi:4-nitrophenyl phosphatase
MDIASDSLTRLKASRGFVFDMDGTLVLGDRRNKALQPLPGSIELIQHLQHRNLPFVIFTNGTTRIPAEYVTALREIGFPLADEAVLTPTSVAADYFVRRKLRRVLALGGEGVWRPLEAAGLTIVPPSEQAEADAIYVGWHRGFTMDDLDAACHAVWRGAKLFAASLSPFFATAQGKALGTSRAIAAAITSITGVRATALGKPSLHGLRAASRRLNVPMADIAVVGDDPCLEVPMAHKGGSLAIAVHTGIADQDAFASVPPDQRPHLTVQNAAELLQLYAGA